MVRLESQANRMKVAMISLICYDLLYKDEILSHLENPDYFDEEILANHPDPKQKFCKMLHNNNVDVEFWYPSCYSKGVKNFTHKYGHILKRISGFNLGTYFSKYLKCDVSFTLLRELKSSHVTHVLLSGYLMNARLPLDTADTVINVCRRNNIKVFPLYGGGSITSYKKLKRKIKLYYLNKANGFICQSKSEIDIMINDCNFPSSKIHYFKNPLDLENFYEIPKDMCTQELNLDKCNKYLLYIGRFVQMKGIHHLINIFHRLSKIESKLRLILVGWGPYYEELERKVEKQGKKDFIIIREFVHNEQLKYYYNIAEMLILPSYSEGTPNVLLEAIACNTISVATNVGGIPDLLSEGVGIMVPPMDENALYVAIMDVLKNGFKINQEKREEILEEINIEKKGKELIRILQGTNLDNP